MALAKYKPQSLGSKIEKKTARTDHFKHKGRNQATQPRIKEKRFSAKSIEVIKGLSKVDLLDEHVGLRPRQKQCRDFYLSGGPMRDGTNPLSKTMEKIIRQFMVANNYVNNGKHLPSRSDLYKSLLVRLDLHKCMIYKTLQLEEQKCIGYLAFYTKIFITEESKDWKAKGMMKWTPSFGLFTFLPHMQQWTDLNWNGDMTLPAPTQIFDAIPKDSISTCQDSETTSNPGNNDDKVSANEIDAIGKRTSFPLTPSLPLTKPKRSRDTAVEDIQASEDKFHQTAFLPMTPPSSTKRKQSIFADSESPTIKRSRIAINETIDLLSPSRPRVEIIDLTNWGLPSATQQEASNLADLLSKAEHVLEGMHTKVVDQIKKGELRGEHG